MPNWCWNSLHVSVATESMVEWPTPVTSEAESPVDCFHRKVRAASSCDYQYQAWIWVITIFFAYFQGVTTDLAAHVFAHCIDENDASPYSNILLTRYYSRNKCCRL